MQVIALCIWLEMIVFCIALFFYNFYYLVIEFLL